MTKSIALINVLMCTMKSPKDSQRFAGKLL